MSDQGPTVFNGRYELLRHIARGGMADVYLARDELLDREVALKVLFPEFANDPSFVERFRREAQAAANLNHPNIVGIYDWGQERGTYYIVMEHVSGRSMADVLRSTGALQPDRAAEIASDVAGALSTAHQAGLVHRDVKLGNILVSDAGDVKVADFGIATALAGGTEAGLTQHGSVMGTATYFSPEQAQGKPVDGRSDLYSLGVVLYEMLSGSPPFQADTPVAVAYKHVQEKPESLTDRGLPIADSLNAITMKLLAKNPANRYPSADDLRADLRRYLAGAHSVPGGAAAGAAAGAVAGAASASTGVAATATADATTAMPVSPAGGAPTTPASPVEAAPTTGQQPQVVLDPNALAYGQDYYYDDDPDNGDDWKRTVALLIGLGVLIFILGFLTIAFANQLGFGGDGDPDDDPTVIGDIPVPDVEGLQVDEAAAQLREVGLEVSVENQPNDTVPLNEVFDQSPPAGEKVEEGTVVTLTVSSGSALKVPVVTGMTQEDASEALFAQGYEVEVETRADIQDFGTVIAVDPPAGTELAAGAVVTITVSTGPETVAVPDLEGQTLPAAINALVAEGFIVEDEPIEEASEVIREGRVIGTLPAKGEFVNAGARITIIVSTGTPTVQVPTVIDLFADTAEQSLRNQGLNVVQEFREVPIGDASVGRVIEQNPAAFTEVELGTTVTIVIGEAAEEPTTTTTTTTSTTTTTTTAPPADE